MEQFTRFRPRLPGFKAGQVLAIFITFAFAASALAAAPNFPSVRMFGVDYVDAHDFARRFALTPSWTVRQKTMCLKNATTRLDLTVHDVDAWLNGLRLFLGEPVVVRAGKLYLSKDDIEELLVPILSGNATEPRSPVKIVVIDAGHGGNDPGNQNSRLKLSEKIYTLDVARRLERLLKAQGFKVVMTRKTDKAVDLDRRAAIANKAKADLFISIHFNGFSRSSVAGAETYVMTPHNQRSSPQAERDDKMVRTRYPANKHDRWNASLGYHVHRALVTELKSADRGLKRFRYSVLRSVDCPAVLVEAAFLSNDAEGRKVSTAAYRQRIAESIARGVQQHAALQARSKPKNLR
jgi:N-acetylmuramoyl-L-alanine amidase